MRLGAVREGGGTRFTLFSGAARAVQLVLGEKTLPMQRAGGGLWTIVAEAGPGAEYGYRVAGEGPGFDPSRILIDPYARAICGDPSAGTGRAVVVDPAYDWRGDTKPNTPWSESLIYECHVKGMTALHPDVPPELRGTYRGMGSQPVIEHLRALGVTAVELLPVHHHHPEKHLRAMGRINYWGYSTLGFFAPDPRFASGERGEQVTEFKDMVRALHAAGIEVIIDVVYNHTAEGGPTEPALSFRGIDPQAYYLHHEGKPVDITGCGNTVNVASPRGLQLVMDSLRYWAGEMRVDGFRFDLAPALGRGTGDAGWRRVYEVMQQDPVLADCKLIAEPWDLGPDGYRLGRFPVGWGEWNDKFRDTVRRFWKGDDGQVPELASRLAGSSDVFGHDGLRGPLASVNYVACHDGFTLADAVSYVKKHNHANGEDNRDGHNANWSTNWGEEGPTSDPKVRCMRAQAQRNLLATVACAQGVPMLGMGDEMGRTQKGNNNGYCLDDETTWVDWAGADQALLAFARKAFAARRSHPLLRREAFLSGEDLTWLRSDGRPLVGDDWHVAGRRALACRMHSDEPGIQDLLVVLNAGDGAVSFPLPPGRWAVRIDSTEGSHGAEQQGALSVRPWTLLLLEQIPHDGPRDPGHAD